VVFLFILISLNMGRIAQKKTIVDNIADSIGLQVASQLGSIGNAMRHEVEMYEDWTPNEKCDINLKLIIGVALLAIVAVVVGVLTFGGGLAALAALGWVGGGILFGAFTTGAGFTIAGGVAAHQTAQAQAQAADEIKTKFNNLDSLQRIIETPIQAVLFSLHEDTAMVRDIFDMDRDKDTQDDIPRFLKWYNLRLNSFPRAGVLVENFYINGFPAANIYSSPIEPFFKDKYGSSRFYIDDDENLMAKKGDDAVRWWVDTNGDRQRDLPIAPWFKNELRAMISTMRPYGYGINYRYVQDGFTIDDSGMSYYEWQAIED
jgi:hypothetical protein